MPEKLPTKSPPIPPENNSVPTANIKINPSEDKQASPEKSKKIITIISFIVLALAIAFGAFYLIRQSQDIRESAASICPAGDQGQVGEECSNLNKCDVAGGCNSSCCATDSDCPSGQTCTVPNGYCRSGKSCNDSGTEDYHKECRDNQCVEVAGSGSDQCSSNSECQTSDDGTYNSCADWGYQEDPTCTADPNCTSEGQDGFCCTNNSGTAVCCYRDGRCYEGQQGNCQDLGNGKIWLAGGLTVEVFKMTGTNVSCPFSSSNEQLVFSGTTAEGGQEFSLDSGECGQIDASGYCGSCKAGCNTTTPTNTPTPTPTPTPLEYQCDCHTINVYDEDWNQLTSQQLTDLRAGDLIYIGVVANNGWAPTYQVSKIRVRVNRSYWQDSDESSLKRNTDTTFPEFYTSYIIPSGILNFKVEAEVYLNASGSMGGWY